MRMEEQDRNIVDTLSRRIRGDDVWAARHDLILTPWAESVLTSLLEGKEAPAVPEHIQQSLDQLNRERQSNPRLYDDCSEESLSPLRNELSASKPRLYDLAHQLIEARKAFPSRPPLT